MSSNYGVLTACLVILAAGVTPDADAQQLGVTPSRDLAPQDQPAAPPLTPPHIGFKALLKDLGHDVKRLPSKESLAWAAGGGGLALAAYHFDGSITSHLSGNPRAVDVFKAGRLLGIVWPVAGSVSVYAWGWLKDQPRTSHIGVDVLQSLAISQGLIQTLKYTVRRERPDRSSRNSFPSGHAASTFAFAAALDRHLSWRYAVPASLAASYVAVSMVPTSRHWASDVVVGATLGMIAGRTVTSHEARPFPVAVSAVPGGAVVTFAPARFNR